MVSSSGFVCSSEMQLRGNNSGGETRMRTVLNTNESRPGRKKKVALVTAALLAVGVGAAIAYWTIGGSGTGTAATGTSENITVLQTTVVTPMYPGDTAQTLEGNFDNTTNEGPVYVGTVTATIDSVVGLDSMPVVGCDATDYILTGAAMTVNAEVPVGAAQGAWNGATIQFNDKLTNQDACKGATVNLAYAIS